MEREKMIEEMIKDVNEAVAKNVESVEREYYSVEYKSKYRGMGTNINTVGIVNELVAANYRKIPVGAVVLTREEYEKLKAEKVNEQGNVYALERRIDDLKRNFQLLHQELEQARKEMGERIYEKAKKKKYVDNDDEGCYWSAIALDDLADICGVEVE